MHDAGGTPDRATHFFTERTCAVVGGVPARSLRSAA